MITLDNKQHLLYSTAVEGESCHNNLKRNRCFISGDRYWLPPNYLSNVTTTVFSTQIQFLINQQEINSFHWSFFLVDLRLSYYLVFLLTAILIFFFWWIRAGGSTEDTCQSGLIHMLCLKKLFIVICHSFAWPELISVLWWGYSTI